MTRSYTSVSSWWHDRSSSPHETGQGLAEYALILTLIAIIAVLALIFLGSDIRTLLSGIGKSV